MPGREPLTACAPAPGARDRSLRIGALMLSLLAVAVALPACADDREWRSLEVTASAYNAMPAQTHPDHPTVTAWGDTLEPGMKAIAVSRDLIELGLTHGTEVRIEGLPGIYVVRDKMHRRWREKIDIYMEDREAAREWGVRAVTIRWQVDPADAGDRASGDGTAGEDQVD